MRQGIPTAVASSGTHRFTKVQAPITAFFPITSASPSPFGIFVMMFALMPMYMTLVSSMTGKKYAVRNGDMASDCQHIVAHVVQIASHADKGSFADLKATYAVNSNSDTVKRAVGGNDIGKPLAYWLEDNFPKGIIIVIRCGGVMRFFI